VRDLLQGEIRLEVMMHDDAVRIPTKAATDSNLIAATIPI
jgi:hypothetical protein